MPAPSKFSGNATMNDGPAPPITPIFECNDAFAVDAVLELSDGSSFRGISFGAEGKSVAGECVFQTG
jgi:carbamoyl-phosphate synthase/aspartate carbamoyltransferase